MSAPLGLLPCATLRCGHTAVLTSLLCEDLQEVPATASHSTITSTRHVELTLMASVHRASHVSLAYLCHQCMPAAATLHDVGAVYKMPIGALHLRCR